MSEAICCFAIAPKSRLYERLHQERVFYILMIELFDVGWMTELDDTSEEFQETLNILMEDFPDIFHSESVTEYWLNEFYAELERSGSSNRCIWVRKAYSEIRKRLSEEVSKIEGIDAIETVYKWMWGDLDFASNLVPERESLRLISVEIVQEGARWLQQIDSEVLFPELNSNLEEEQLRQFKQWRKMYLAAAEYQEAILVGVSGA